MPVAKLQDHQSQVNPWQRLMTALHEFARPASMKELMIQVSELIEQLGEEPLRQKLQLTHR